MIPGNHDTYFKNTNEVNSPELLLKDYDNITDLSRGNGSSSFAMREIFCLLLGFVLIIIKQTMEAIDETDAKVCFGHYELWLGFQMYKGHANDHGMDPKQFLINSILFALAIFIIVPVIAVILLILGNPYEITWSDYDDPRGFHIYDTRNK